MGPHLWGKGKSDISEVYHAKHVVKHTFAPRASTGGVRKGGIIKGVWLPRVAITP